MTEYISTLLQTFSPIWSINTPILLALCLPYLSVIYTTKLHNVIFMVCPYGNMTIGQVDSSVPFLTHFVFGDGACDSRVG